MARTPVPSELLSKWISDPDVLQYKQLKINKNVYFLKEIKNVSYVLGFSTSLCSNGL